MKSKKKAVKLIFGGLIFLAVFAWTMTAFCEEPQAGTVMMGILYEVESTSTNEMAEFPCLADSNGPDLAEEEMAPAVEDWYQDKPELNEGVLMEMMNRIIAQLENQQNDKSMLPEAIPAEHSPDDDESVLASLSNEKVNLPNNLP